MIRVVPATEPSTFSNSVRNPGLRAIAEMVGETPDRPMGKRFQKLADQRELIPFDKFPSYWTEALDDLMTAYSQICAYSCFKIHVVTGGRSVDHMIAKSKAWNHVYEWTNYRLACSRLNARKNSFDDVLDPFEIHDGWFQLELVGFQVVPNKKLDDPMRTSVQNTIKRLGLNEFCRARAHDAEYYWGGDVTLRVLTEESPFVTKELRRQGRLLPGDR
jgi:hypothetical protein